MEQKGQYDSFNRFVREIGWSALGPAVVLATLAGSAASALLSIANQTARLVVDGDQEEVFGYELRFLVFISLFVICRWLSFLQTNRLVETNVTKLRTRIVDKLTRTELEFIDGLDRGDAHARLANNISEISRAFQRLTRGFQEVFIVVFCILYLAAISMAAMLLALSVIVCLVGVHSLGSRFLKAVNRRQNECNARLFGSLYSLFYGFKEVKLNSARNEALFDTILERADQSRELRLKRGKLNNSRLAVSEGAGYLMLGAAVFLLPQYTALQGEALVKVVTMMVFVRPSMAFISYCLYLMSHINLMLSNMYQLEHQIDQELERAPHPLPDQPVSPFRGFQTISFEGLGFAYRDAEGNRAFSVGPMDLEVRRGETTFITGGNGAGKSTTFKLLTGLYRPEEGRILVDGEPVPWDQMGSYRQISAAIFGDFHLFDQLYGIENVREQRVTDLLRFVKLDQKVTFSQNRFSTQELSTGQRKRMALITSLMEDREILFLDEWAADQDWHFRDYFYRHILPELKRQGKTVVAITHDEQYVDTADNVLQLDLGKLVTSHSDVTMP